MTQRAETAAEPGALPPPKERRRLRESRELTHDEVAAAVGVTASTVRSWESGRTEPRGRTREAYAKLLAELAKPPADPAQQPAEEHRRGGTALRVAGAVRAFAKGGGGSGHGSPAAARTRPKAAAKRAAKPPGGPAGRTASQEPQDRPRRADTTTPAPPTDHQGLPAAAPAAAPDTGTAPSGRRPAAGEPLSAGPAGQPLAGPPPEPGPVQSTAAEAFDALYARAAPALLRQSYLLTGRRAIAREAVERAFQRAWAHWPEVATDRDPVGWVRAAVYEYALSPWHRFRRAHKHPDRAPADLGDRALLEAMLSLSAAHRRTVLLYDGVGLDLPDTAAETEASTPTAGSRLLHAHGHLAARLPELNGVAPEKQSALLHDRLGSLTPAVRLEVRPPAAVRRAGEHRARFWTRAAVGMTAVIATAGAYTAATAPTRYEPPVAPGTNVSGVPAYHGPEQLTDEDRLLQEKLRSEPATGPARLVPQSE
ncbi:DNA-directed RNA polymerase sigma-70 factor [Streptomyces venezuelae]|uniref:DNA-directed RNA polymerase sigma-70 factor n=1 Tax=Streptomyces venezuelae TaxID=54571 RepID=A0A5P2D3L8_STRVZ|nr:helix-turn-helix domain-containing protein [Streptomyces venezuelae]QES49745.1 DNA-directed RNA polymerase sigma-70 factor [Streptomyces venezuelae]